ncbi:MAG: hypothetical protein OEZ27_04390, partial [Nitrospinota bacterium]|nr:hypothetical protein [Nitrospinota bacterium]
MITPTKMEYINRLVAECLSEDGDSLEMKGRFIGDEGLEALMLADKLEDIENLDLSKNKLSHRGIPHLVNSDRLGKLKRLYLGENSISDKGAILLSQASFIPNLVHMDMRHNNIESDGGMALAQAPFKKIQVFIIQDNPIGDEALKAMSLNPGYMHVRKLNIYRAGITDQGIKTLAKSKVFKKLKHLNLARNILRVDAALALANTKTLLNV